MRMSCNGCRVLRKGCGESCCIRPCLQWIKNPDSQANATVFLAKFYGRAGLINLINAGPEHLRPAVFRSLLYEACGRIVNPIYGSMGLLWSGSWQFCQAAVDSVLKGAPIVPIPSETLASTPAPPFKAYDIRHINRESRRGESAEVEVYKVGRCRKRFKRTGAMPTASPASPESSGRQWYHVVPETEFHPARSHESSGSRPENNDSMYSVETVEASHVSQGEPSHLEEAEVGLELTLGIDPASCLAAGRVFDGQPREGTGPAAAETCGVDLLL